MANPNPEIYGSPDTWLDSKNFGGMTTAPESIHAKRAQICGIWTNPDQPDYDNYEKGSLQWGILSEKITAQQPIDKSITAIGQGRDSAFHRLGVYANQQREGEENPQIRRIGTATYDTNVLNFAAFDARCPTSYAVYANRAFNQRYNFKKSSQFVWSPDGEYNRGTSTMNGTFNISPFTYYESRTILLQIQVSVTDLTTVELVANPPTSPPATHSYNLETWKNEYSDHSITAAFLNMRYLNSYESSTGDMQYRLASYGGSTYQKAAFMCLDKLTIAQDGGTNAEIYHYGLYGDNSNIARIVLFSSQTGLSKWDNNNEIVALMPFDHVFGNTIQFGTTQVWYQIPYSDEAYEALMCATACFGCPFTPSRPITSNSNITFNHDFTDTDLCLPIISDVNGVGVLQGDYTRGEDNVDNDFISLKSVYDWQPTHHDIVHDNPDGTEYFNQHSNAYDSALSNLNNNYRIRLEILTDEETVIGEITKDLSLTATGQITINYEQITRRSCSLSLINVDNKYIPTKNSPFWLNRKFKLWLGLVVGKDTYWWSQGIFYTVSANATGRILSIEGVDKGGALDGTLKLNMTEAQYQFKRGKALTEMIKQTLALDVGNPYGANNSPIGFGGNRPIDSQPPLIGIEYYGFNTVADISIDANSYISEMFVNMAELYAADCYYNTNGNLVFEQHIDSYGYNYVPTQWSFTDLSSTFEDVNYEYSYEGENVVTVYTNTTEAGVRNVAWTAYNTNPLSPLNVATGIRRAPHIEIPYYHNEQLPQDQQEAQQIKDCRSTANHYLLANSMLGMTLNFNAPIIPHMDVNKTIQISDQYADIEDGIYVVQSITIPLSSDKMQISATNINWLPNDMIFSGVLEIVQSNNNQNGGAET